jgi:hypothetical protein
VRHNRLTRKAACTRRRSPCSWRERGFTGHRATIWVSEKGFFEAVGKRKRQKFVRVFEGQVATVRTVPMLLIAGLRIRIHFIRIRIQLQLFSLNTDPDRIQYGSGANPDPGL